MWLLKRMLRRLIRKGTLKIIGHDGRTYFFGVATEGFPDVAVRLTDRRAALAIVSDPRLGAAEAYIDGRLIVEKGDIRDLVDLIRGNGQWEEGGQLGIGNPLRRALHAVGHRLDRLNWHSRARRNVAHHYDLSDRLYDLFLDSDRQYSCAYFTDPANDLETAQRDKKAHIAAKLNLEPGVSTLDIGCGWGGTALAIHAITGGPVLGITLSTEQLAVARRRAEGAGVADKVRFDLIDYRDVEGRFDRIVSIGMFEHVGPPNYHRFFAKCRALLAEDGVMLLHSIGRMGGPGSTDRFTTKYIFPGGYIPALSEIVAASEKVRLIASDVETLRLHYGLTIDRWYDRTMAARDAIVALYDERFYRLWLFYLAGAGSAFRSGGLCNYQIQYIRRRDTLPIIRDYMAREEAALRPAIEPIAR